MSRPLVSVLVTLYNRERYVTAVFGPPRFYRPTLADARRAGGPVGQLLDAACAAMAVANQPSLDAHRLDEADIVVCHDMVAAEMALARCAPDRVWLMFHTPMPLGLYQAWSWALPEMDWRELLDRKSTRLNSSH